jgi:hypothetical protein
MPPTARIRDSDEARTARRQREEWPVLAELLATLIEEVSVGNTEQFRRKKPLHLPRPDWVPQRQARPARAYVAPADLPPDVDPETLLPDAAPLADVVHLSDYSRRAVGVLLATARHPGGSR